MEYNSSVLFWLKHYKLCSKGAQYSENFWDCWVLESKFVKFLMSILKRQVNSSSNFTSFFIVMTHNFSVNFKLIHFLLWIKGSHQSQTFKIFQVLWWKCSSCHFPNHKSVFLQIFHHSSVPWKITPLDRSKWKFWEFRVLASKFTKFVSLWKQLLSFSSNFASIFSIMRHKSSTFS